MPRKKIERFAVCSICGMEIDIDMPGQLPIDWCNYYLKSMKERGRGHRIGGIQQTYSVCRKCDERYARDIPIMLSLVMREMGKRHDKEKEIVGGS